MKAVTTARQPPDIRLTLNGAMRARCVRVCVCVCGGAGAGAVDGGDGVWGRLCNILTPVCAFMPFELVFIWIASMLDVARRFDCVQLKRE